MKAFCKLNIFLKIIGTRDDYHEISSRFILYEKLYDEIEFTPKISDEIILDNKIMNNIVFKAIDTLRDIGFSHELDEFFKNWQIILKKNIPSGAGLGGGSSDAGAFLRLINDKLNLGLNSRELIKIASKIGADVAFFASGLKSANVSGIGEIIDEFSDDIPNLDIITSNIFCATPKIYGEFRKNISDFSFVNSQKLAENLINKTSKQILANYENYELNDLLKPCLNLYPNLQIAHNEFLSGSGSAKFKLD